MLGERKVNWFCALLTWLWGDPLPGLIVALRIELVPNLQFQKLADFSEGVFFFLRGPSKSSYASSMTMLVPKVKEFGSCCNKRLAQASIPQVRVDCLFNGVPSNR